MPLIIRFAVLVATLVLACPSLARTPISGDLTAIALHPDGEQIFITHKNKKLFILNTASLRITKRRELPVAAREIAFNQTGSRLILMPLSSKEPVQILNTKNLKVTQTLKDYNQVTAAPDADLMVLSKYGYRQTTPPALASMSTGKIIRRFNLPEGAPVNGMDYAISRDGKRVAMYHYRQAEDEVVNENINRAFTPDMPQPERDALIHAQDGKGSHLYTFDAETGKQRNQQTLGYWNPITQVKLFFVEDDIVILTSQYGQARITPNSEISYLDLWPLAYGYGYSPVSKRLITTWSSLGRSLDLATNEITMFYTDDKDKLKVEFIYGVTDDAKGRFYAITSQSRLYRFDTEGNIDQIVPIY